LFYRKALYAINKSFGSKLKVRLPIKNKDKSEIMEWVTEKGIKTYYCYEGGDEPCGKCKGCLQTRQAYDKIDVFKN